MKIALMLALTAAGAFAAYNDYSEIALAVICALLLWAGYEIYSALRSGSTPRDRP